MKSSPEKTRPLIEMQGGGLCYRMNRSFLKSQRSNFWAVRNISLKLYEGDRLGVVGRNGAGKSTLLSMLAGIILPDEGKISAQNVKRQLLSFQLGFEPVLTGEENAILGGLYLGRTQKQIKHALPQIYAMSELGDFFHKPLHTYSSGMRARLGFAVAMETTPDILLLDEILGTVGDEAFRRKSASVLADKLKKSIKTTVIVSHDVKTIREHCNRAILINNGTLLADGAVEDVLKEYDKLLPIPGRNVTMAASRFRPPLLPLHLRLLKKAVEFLSDL